MRQAAAMENPASAAPHAGVITAIEGLAGHGPAGPAGNRRVDGDDHRLRRRNRPLVAGRLCWLPLDI